MRVQGEPHTHKRAQARLLLPEMFDSTWNSSSSPSPSNSDKLSLTRLAAGKQTSSAAAASSSSSLNTKRISEPLTNNCPNRSCHTSISRVVRWCKPSPSSSSPLATLAVLLLLALFAAQQASALPLVDLMTTLPSDEAANPNSIEPLVGAHQRKSITNRPALLSNRMSAHRPRIGNRVDENLIDGLYEHNRVLSQKLRKEAAADDERHAAAYQSDAFFNAMVKSTGDSASSVNNKAQKIHHHRRHHQLHSQQPPQQQQLHQKDDQLQLQQQQTFNKQHRKIFKVDKNLQRLEKKSWKIPLKTVALYSENNKDYQSPQKMIGELNELFDSFKDS